MKSTRIGPDDTGKDAHELSDVCTVTALDPAVAAPIVKPLMVTMNAAVVLIAAPEVVSTTAVLLVAPHVMLKPTILLAPAATKGVIEGAKKLGGYDSMKEPPGGMAESTEKVRITAAFGLRAIRFEDSMKNCCTLAPHTNQASNCCTSASESFTLYTRRDRIAKSDVSVGHVLTAILVKNAHPFAKAVSIPFILKELLRSDPITQLPLEAESVAGVGVIHPQDSP